MKNVLHSMRSGNRKSYFFIAAIVVLSMFKTQAQTVTPASGGSAISADNVATSTYTTLTGPVYSEVASGNVGTGTIILNAPTGFNFDVGGTAPTVLITRLAGGGNNTRNINGVASGTSVAITSRTATTITFTITSASNTGVTCSMTWQNIRVIPTAGTPLASGNITKTGTSTMSGVTNSSTNFGALTEVAGVTNNFAFNTISSAQCSNSIPLTITARDQYGNTTNFSGTVNMTSNAGTVTPATSNAFSGGVLNQTFSVSGSGTARTMTATRTSPSATGTSNAFTINAQPNISGTLSVCAGSTTTLTGTGTPHGTTPWASASPSFATVNSSGVVNGVASGSSVITYMDNNNCSNTATVTVNASNAVSVSIAASPSSTVCAGTNVTFTATPTNGGGSPSYQWKLNGGNVGTNSTTYSNNSLANGDVVTCEMISNLAGCLSNNPATSNAINMTVNPTNAVSVSIGASPSGAICVGTNVTFTATPTNGGGSPSYQWKLNGGNVGSNSTTYSNSSLANGDVVTCVLTSNVSCPTGNPATSNAINMTVNPTNAVSVSIGASPSGAICAGTNVTFTATPTNGGASPSYQWKLNGGNVGTNSATYSNNALTNGDVVTCELTSNVSCPTGNPATSNSINMTVNSYLSVSVSVGASPSSTICAGTNVTFTATPTNGGATPSYQWKLNGGNVGTNSASYSNNSLTHGDVVSCVLTSNYACPTGNPAASNNVTMTVNPTNAVSVSIGASPSGAICAGTNVTFTATPTNGGASPSYQWKLNGGNVGTNSTTYSNNALANGDVVTCVLTSNVSCPTGNPATSNAINMTVNPILPVSVSIGASPSGAICAGTNVTFTATPTNGGTSPVYQWKVNGGNVGTNSATYSNNALANGDVVTCELTSNATCPSGNPATSNAINMTVNPILPVSISISPSPSSTICAGTNVTFTATPTNGGATPSYQWKVNGSNVGTNSPTYSNASLANGNVVTCVLTSNATCPSGNPATSNSVTMTVNANNAVSVSIAASPSGAICAGTNVTFTATPTNGGASPSYQWKLNGGNVGSGGTTYSNSSLADGDVVTCELTSNVSCPTGNPAISNAITMDVNPLPAVTLSAASSAICFNNGTVLTATNSGGIANVTYSGSNGTNTTITNSSASAYTYSSINLSGSGGLALSDGDVVVVTVTINHDRTADLDLFLVDPSGTRAMLLSSDNGGAGGTGYVNTVFRTDASTSITTGTSPMTGTFLPEGSITTAPDRSGSVSGTYNAVVPANALDGAPIDGNWTLRVWDDAGGSGNNNATLDAWSLSIIKKNEYTSVFSGAATISAVSYSGGNGTTAQVTVTPPVGTNNYSVVTTDRVGCTASNNVTVTVNALPSASVSVAETSGTANNDGITCSGNNVTLTANPASGMTYNWAAPISATGNNKVVSPTANTTYTVTVTNSGTGCSATANTSITVNALPAPTIAANETSGTNNNDGTICIGASVTLAVTPATGVTYDWAAPISASGNNQVVNPLSTTGYTVTVTNTTTNCAATANRTVTVNALPTPTITFSETSGTTNNDGTICNGASATLIANPTTGATYAWAAPVGGTGNNKSVSPSSTSSYTVTVTITATGCSAPASNSVTVNALPSPSITYTETSGTTNNDGVTCAGDAVTLTANPTVGMTYTWAAPVGGTGNNKVVSPTTTTNYTVSVTETTTNCMAPVTQSVTVNAVPVTSITATETSGTTNNDGTICDGASVTLTANPISGMTYAWAAPISANGNGQIVNPSSTTGYTVTITNNTTLCSATASRTITVNALPAAAMTYVENFGLTANDGIICAGNSVTLVANPVSGMTYVWASPPGGTGNNKSVTPSSTTSYNVSVTQTSTGCMATANGTVTVNPLPTPTITVNETSGVANNDNIICSGGSATLTANPVSGMSYAWAAPVGGTGNNKVVSPSSNTSYTVTVTNSATGCFAPASSATITVQTMPTFSVHPVGASLCLGQPFSMNVSASGTAITRQWHLDGNPISGATTNNYSVASSTTADGGNYHVVISNSCAVVSSNTATINLTAPVTPPYAENFESITAPNQLPGCMTTTNLGSKTFTRTYGGVGAHSGTKFGAWSQTSGDYFFTPGVLLPAGVPYEFFYWFWSDNTSAQTSMSAFVGTAPTPSAMTTPVGTTRSGGALAPTQTYQKYAGVFTPATTGVYYFGAYVTTNPGAADDKVVIDDIGFIEACQGTPEAGTASISQTCINSGSSVNLSVTGYTTDYGGIVFQWQRSPKGLNTWTNINGATDSIFTATNITAHTDFRCEVSCIYSNQSDYTNVVTVNINPTPYNVSGGACAPVNIGVSGSQIGVSYQIILNGNVHTTPPQMGTGGPINFGNQVDSGVYAVLATDINTGCTRMMTGVATVAYCTSTWLGVTDSLWTTQTNWDPAAVPNNCYVNVIIPNGTTFRPEISGTNIYVRNMDVASGVQVRLRGQNLHVCGNWTGGAGSNASVVGNGTVHMVNNTQTQNISGKTQFDTLQINNDGGGVIFAAGTDVYINGGLHLEHGNLDVSAGMLTLLSKSATHHAYIDDFTFGFDGTISGNIRAQRFIPVTGTNQHFVSVPLANVSLSQIGASGPDGAYIIPRQDCDERTSAQNSPYGTCFVYNDGYMGPNRCMLGNWMIKSQGNMVVGKGYSTYQQGNAVVTVEGTANTGDINVSGQRNSGYPTVMTLQLQPIESGWNLVGNPYPSSIDLTIDRTADGFQNQVQVWKATGINTGTWEPMLITGVPGTVVIPPFQAFMVRVMPGSVGYNHTYRFYQSERIRDNKKRFYNNGADHSLTLELTFGTNRSDETHIEFNSDASTDFDDKLDANKPASSVGTPTIYSHLNSNLWYGINSLPSLKQTTTVPVGLRAEMNGAMKISAKGIQTFDPTTYIYLEDKKTGVWHNLRNGDYNFTAAKTDNYNRFVVHFTPPAQILTSDASCNGPGMIQIEQPGSANWNYTLENQNNVVVSSGILNAGSSVSVSANAGTYLLTLNDNNGYTVMKNIHVTGAQPIVAAFQSSLTAAIPNESIIFTSTTPNATTYQWDFGDGATGSGENTTHSYFSEGVYIVQLTVTNEGGCFSTAQQSINVKSNTATSLNSIVANRIDIWSSQNTVYVDFTKETKVDAEIDMYNVMGQLISREQFKRSAVYSKQLDNMAAAYVIVKVMNDDQTTTKKVFIAK